MGKFQSDLFEKMATRRHHSVTYQNKKNQLYRVRSAIFIRTVKNYPWYNDKDHLMFYLCISLHVKCNPQNPKISILILKFMFPFYQKIFLKCKNAILNLPYLDCVPKDCSRIYDIWWTKTCNTNSFARKNGMNEWILFYLLDTEKTEAVCFPRYAHTHHWY